MKQNVTRTGSEKHRKKLAEYQEAYGEAGYKSPPLVQGPPTIPFAEAHPTIPMNEEEAREAFRREHGLPSKKPELGRELGDDAPLYYVGAARQDPGSAGSVSSLGTSRKGFVRPIAEPDVTAAEMRAHLRDSGQDVRGMDSASVATNYDGAKEAPPYTEVTASRASDPSVEDLPDVPPDEPNPGVAYNPEDDLHRVAPEIFEDPGIGDLPSVPPPDVQMREQKRIRGLSVGETTEEDLNKRLAVLQGTSAAQVKRTIAAKATAAITQANLAVQHLAAATGATPADIAVGSAKAIYKEGNVAQQLATLPPPATGVRMTPEQLASTEHVYQRMADTLGISLKEVMKRQERIVAEAQKGPQSEQELWERLIKLKGDPNVPLLDERDQSKWYRVFGMRTEDQKKAALLRDQTFLESAQLARATARDFGRDPRSVEVQEPWDPMRNRYDQATPVSEWSREEYSSRLRRLRGAEAELAEIYTFGEPEDPLIKRLERTVRQLTDDIQRHEGSVSSGAYSITPDPQDEPWNVGASSDPSSPSTPDWDMASRDSSPQMGVFGSGSPLLNNVIPLIAGGFAPPMPPGVQVHVAGIAVPAALFQTYFEATPTINVGTTRVFHTGGMSRVGTSRRIKLRFGWILLNGRIATISVSKLNKENSTDMDLITAFLQTYFLMGAIIAGIKYTSDVLITSVRKRLPGTVVLRA